MSEVQTGPADPNTSIVKNDARLFDPKNVFGWKNDKGHPQAEGFDRDKLGRPIEHGIGSPGHETSQHYQAILKYSTVPGDKEGAQAAVEAILAGVKGDGVRKAFDTAKAAALEKF